ncbi:hypothetical protein BGZ61DRAFT_458723 [Ilyonectria robusta]|uniref:uncharacterized protein n=1 Tax=Ilyonectria robusta TaxID=1079257 RepID=UPI001E8DB5FB|nr:uncharacterized protein BGZ61DRAFT_458723 [Ilyonectria robusta]KAH8673046.1 hypothetical protein BGZ61DRAFT_458723 [Ilyonectria robusta]
MVTNRTCHVRVPSFRVMSCLETNISCAIHGTLASCRNKKVFVRFRIRTQVQRPAATIHPSAQTIRDGAHGSEPSSPGPAQLPRRSVQACLVRHRVALRPLPHTVSFWGFHVCEHERYANPVGPGLRALLSCGETSGARCHPLSAFHRHRGLLLLPAA